MAALVTAACTPAAKENKVTQAIGAGNGPDIGLSYSTDIVGKFCRA